MEIDDLYRAAEIEGALSDPDTAHLTIDGGKVHGKERGAGPDGRTGTR